MPIQLDMITMFLTLAISHLFTMALILAGLWRSESKHPSVKTFAVAKCLQAAAWTYLAVCGGARDMLIISLSNSLLFIGNALEITAVLGIQRLLNRSIRIFYIALTVVLLLTFHLILFFDNRESLRILVASIGTSLILIVPACRMIRERTLVQRIMAVFYAVVIIGFFLRGAAAVGTRLSMSFFTPGIDQTLLLLITYLVMISGNTGFVLLMKHRADQALLYMAAHDDLTGTLNRRSFERRAEQALQTCARNGQPLSLLLFDVDQFKAINDAHGHVAGDHVLQNMTALIRVYIGSRGLFARYGGDEFAILLPGVSQAAAAETAERIRRAVQESALPDCPVRYTISLGLLTVRPDPHTRFDKLYSQCDQALYQAKHDGRNQVSQISV